MAKAVNALGPICKVVGLIAGLFVVFFGIMGTETLMRPNPSITGIANYQTQHNVYLISVIFFGLFVAFAGWGNWRYSCRLRSTFESHSGCGRARLTVS